MSNNINVAGINDYCDRFAKKVADDFFKDRKTITGKEILELNPVKQINLFVIKALLSEWKKESEKLKSNYFDYNDIAVKTAFNKFSNVLSRHIMIEKKDFIPLLTKATHQSLLLIFSPYDYYTHLIHDHEKSDFQVATLRETAKYVKINQPLFMAFLTAIENKNITTISKENAAKMLEEAFSTIAETPEDVEGYLAQLSETVPLSQEVIYGESISEVERTQEPIKEERKQPEAGKQLTDNLNLFEESSVQTLNEQHSNNTKPTLADIHRKQKIDSIRKHMSINQRFMFINNLFDGSVDDFNQAIDKFESFESLSNALAFIDNSYPNWDKESDEVSELIELVEKRLV